MLLRLIGTEWETCLLVLGEDGKHDATFLHRPENQKAFLDNLPSPPALRHLDCGGYNYRRALSTGGLIYTDTGHHVEYAAPEGVEAREALLHYKFGEFILGIAQEETNLNLQRQGVGRKIRLFRGNLDSAHASYGFHENYLVRRNENTLLASPNSPISVRTDFVSAFLPFLMVRPLFGGIGLLGKKNDGRLEYNLSQRITQMTGLTGDATTSCRTMINTRDEPHADERFWRRLHLICGDTIGLEPALFLTLSATSCVLGFIEEGFHKERDLGLPDISGMSDLDLVNTWAEFNSDPALKVARRIGDKTYTIVDLNEIYRDAVRRYCEVANFPTLKEQHREDLKLTLRLWDWFIEKAKEARPHEALKRKAEWAAKLSLLEKYCDKHGLDFAAPARTTVRRRNVRGNEAKETTLFHLLKDFDLEFHESGPESILGALTRRGGVDRIVTDEETRAFITPPLSCRSFLRGRILKTLDDLSQELNPDGTEPIRIGGTFWQDLTVEIQRTPQFSAPIPVRFTFNI